MLNERQTSNNKAGKAGATPNINYPGNMNALDSKTHNEKLKRDLRAKEEEAKTLTLEARQACKDLAEAKVNMSTEKKKAMEELASLQEKNAHYKRILNELNAEIPCKGQERQRDELKASVDELEAKFGDVLKEKLELERQIVEMKRTKASKEERMDKIAKQNEKIENFMITAKCKLEKDKEKSEALDKDNRDLQDLCTGMKREVEEFLREMNEISKASISAQQRLENGDTKFVNLLDFIEIQLDEEHFTKFEKFPPQRLSEEHEHLQREGEKTKYEYEAFKEKVRDEMNKKCAELDELKKELEYLESQQVPRKKSGKLLRGAFVCRKQ
ncbi:hypothetical protein P5673_011980 [Acropora cervicornis]|uniref:Uncharacterized protein n=1 Tax=Acropora cervicornis TaxID=6130 RepID=A0AAD9QND7_ACRCE|nr:hypothetical protein P5673_011980 [Acropora cervicornis]